MNKRVEFSSIVGLTISEITGMEKDSELVTIKTECGRTFIMHHEPDCCERVDINDVCGSVHGLIGVPVLLAEETENNDNIDGMDTSDDSHTWTFYRIGTINGTVVIRWLGESNGYYSEGVDFVEVTES